MPSFFKELFRGYHLKGMLFSCGMGILHSEKLGWEKIFLISETFKFCPEKKTKKHRNVELNNFFIIWNNFILITKYKVKSI